MPLFFITIPKPLKQHPSLKKAYPFRFFKDIEEKLPESSIISWEIQVWIDPSAAHTSPPQKKAGRPRNNKPKAIRQWANSMSRKEDLPARYGANTV